MNLHDIISTPTKPTPGVRARVKHYPDRAWVGITGVLLRYDSYSHYWHLRPDRTDQAMQLIPPPDWVHINRHGIALLEHELELLPR